MTIEMHPLIRAAESGIRNRHTALIPIDTLAEYYELVDHVQTQCTHTNLWHTLWQGRDVLICRVCGYLYRRIPHSAQRPRPTTAPWLVARRDVRGRIPAELLAAIDPTPWSHHV